MCMTVYEPARKADYGNQRELAERLGVSVKRLPLGTGYDDRALLGRMCLCPIDVEAALTTAGIAFRRDDTGDIILD